MGAERQGTTRIFKIGEEDDVSESRNILGVEDNRCVDTITSNNTNLF